MIDWITCRFEVSHMPDFGRRYDINEQGAIVVEKDLPINVSSDATNIMVAPYGSELIVSGNPSKFLYGHNVIGPDSWQVVDDFAREVMHTLGIEDYRMVKVTRIDITYSYLMNSLADVEAALQHIGKATAERWGRPVSRHGTQYFGSRGRQQMKFYNKTIEARRAKLNLPPILRCELTLGRKFIEEMDSWENLKIDELRHHYWTEAMNRLRIDDIQISDINELPRRLAKVYGLWQAGVDLRQCYARGTLYNYAAALRRYGVDIWASPEPSNVVHLRRTLSARPLSVEDLQGYQLTG